MKKKGTPEWRLETKDVVGGTTSFSSGASGKGGRKTQARSRKIYLKHLPTDIRVEGEIPQGHYSREEMRRAHQALEEALFAELEERVAKALRIKGR